MNHSQLRQIIKEEISKALNKATNKYSAAALELVNIAEPMVKGGGYIDNLRSERRKAANVKTADQLSDFYYELNETLAEAGGTDSVKFPKEAKKIVVDKYKLSITDEYGFPMKFK